MPKTIILGAGISGLSAVIKTGLGIFEKEEIPGGLRAQRAFFIIELSSGKHQDDNDDKHKK